ncbi:MAG: proprotein convertase P-domain-containing protein [Fimbriiglobus sp.]
MSKQPIRDLLTRWAFRMRRQRITPKASWITIQPRLLNLEDRLAPAALIAPTASAPTVVIQNPTTDFSATSVASDPLDPTRQVTVAQSLRNDGVQDIVASFTTNAGATWIPMANFNPKLVDHSAPNANTRFAHSSQPAVTFGRDGTLYVIYLQHTADRSAGVVVVQSYVFGPTSPGVRALLPDIGTASPEFANGGSATQQVLYRWSNGQEPASTPTIALDNSIGLYSEGPFSVVNTMVNPLTGRPKAVYAAWSTFGTAPTANDRSFFNRFNPTAIWTSVTTDAGSNFSSPIPVNGTGLSFTNSKIMLGPSTGYYSDVVNGGQGGAQPFVSFSSATSSAPGRVVIGWIEASKAANATSPVYLDVTHPDNGIAANTAGSVVSFTNTSNISIDEAKLNGLGAGIDAPVTTSALININAAQLAGLTKTDRIVNLTTTIAIAHPRLEQVSAKLVGPDNVTTITLFNNRNNNEGNAISPPPQYPFYNEPRGISPPPAPASPAANPPYLGIGRANNLTFGTTFDDYAARRIGDPLNKFPYIGTYKAESWIDLKLPSGPYTGAGALSVFVGKTVNDLVGTWRLDVTDNRNDRITEAKDIAQQFIDYFSINVTASNDDSLRPGMSADQKIGTPLLTPAVPAAGIDPFTNPTTAPISPGIYGLGSAVSVAFDNSLQPFNDGSAIFERPSGMMHVAFTNAANGFDVFTMAGQIDPATNKFNWFDPVRVNDDTPFDNFSEGNRAQFHPTIAVEPATGNIGVMWYDARYDASNVRAATYFAQSTDGGKTFKQSPDGGFTESPQIYLNASRKAINAIDWAATGKNLGLSTVTIEPIPSNIAKIGGVGLGSRQSLVPIGPGKFAAYWTGNSNTTGSSLFRTVITGAAGPRIINGDMGPVVTNSLNEIFITFDRPVDITTLTAADVVIQHRLPTNSILTAPRTLVPGTDYGDPIPENAGGVGGRGATLFRIPMLIPQTALGTYSYTVGQDVTDLVRVSLPVTANPIIDDPTIRGPIAGLNGPVTQATFVPTPAPVLTPQTTLFTATVPYVADGLLVGLPRVALNLNKPRLSDLTITLIAPNGIRTVLFDGLLRGALANSISGEFRAPTDGGLPLTANGPYTGLMAPEDPSFFALRGTPIDGVWTIEIVDRASGTPGAPLVGGPATLTNFSLTFTTTRRNIVTTFGNKMDQNNDGITGSSTLDVFAAPRPDARRGNTTPFTFPYDSLTSPLIITGPRFVDSTVPDQPVTADNLVLNTSINALDINFDRDMNPATFEADGRDIVRISGPTGVIFDKFEWDTQFPGKPYPVSVAPLSAKSFRVSFPTQVLSGAYNIEFGANIADTNGNLLDNNRNAGLAILRGGGSPTTGQVLVNTYTATGPTVAILPGQTVERNLIINDLFTVEQTLSKRIQLKINVTHAFVPDLEGELVAPDGTTIRLFTNVGDSGTIQANFSNTLFDDGGSTTIQSGLAPFSSGPYTPQFPLSALRGGPSRVLDGSGNAIPWRLRIINTGSLSGSIGTFSLSLPFVVPGTGLGETIDDRFSAPFRIFNQDATNPLTKQVWTPVGPAPTNSQANVSRITGLAVDPSDPTGNTVYAGGASGGIWKSTNFLTEAAAGPNWIPLTDFGPTFALNTGSIAVFPRNGDPNQSIIFALTGEGDTGSPGVGVLRSMDGGRTWVVLDSLNNVAANGSILPIDSNLRDRRFFRSTGFKIVVDPTATPTGDVIVYMAVSGTNGGVYRSTDTGRTWTLMRAGNATDVHLAQGSRSTSSVSSGALEFLYAAFRGEGVFTSPQATIGVAMTLTQGTQGNQLIRDFSTTPDVEVAVNAAPQSPNGAKGRISISGPAATGDVLQDTFYAGWLYAVVSTAAGKTDGVYLTKDFGRNWTQVRFPVFVPSQGNGFPTNNETRADQELFAPPGLPNGQGNYNIGITVDATDPEVVYVAGLGNGNGVPMPGGGLIRIDVSAINDVQSFNVFDHSSAKIVANNGVTTDTVGGVTFRDPLGPIPSIKGFAVNTTNLSRNPNFPFDTNSTVKVNNAGAFTNTGENAKWSGFTDILNTADLHRIIAFRDQLTGKTRLIGSGDHQVFTGVDDGLGNMVTNLGFANSVNNTRNGNLQLLQMYSGAAQPSQLAVDISQAFFYGMAQDNGFPVSGPDALSKGNLNWVGPRGDGAGVGVDETGSGTAYQYRWPCCQGGSGAATDFFRVIAPPGPGGSPGVSRTNGLLQAGDDPGADKGQWPQIADVGYFKVNPVDPNGIVVSSQVGRIFRTTNQGKNWFPIGEPTQLDSTYARAVAFGAPDPAVPGQLNNFIYAGTVSGNMFVSFDGGSKWNNISTGIAGNGRVMQIMPNPQRGSRSAYAVTDAGVFFLADAKIGQWTEISGVGNNSASGDIFTLRDPIFGNANNETTNPLPNSGLPFNNRSLTSIVADWRYAIPTDPAFPTKNTFPILYVGAVGGVYRSLNNGVTWESFPGQSTLMDPTTGLPLTDPATGQPRQVPRGGWLPNAEITDLDLSLGNIDPLTGYPQQSSGGFNMLTASTYGRGMWAIRLEDPASVAQFNVLFQSGPRVAGLAASASNTLRLRFDAAVDPATLNLSDIILRDSGGNIIPVTGITTVFNPGPNGFDLRNLFEITFTPLNTADTYTVTVGPEIYDFAGFGMNQNADKTNGDKTFSPVTGAAIDAYTGNFVTVNSVLQPGNLFLDMPYSTRAGDPVTVTVSAVGPDGLIIPGYTGTISFASSDSKISIGDGLPNMYQFNPLDKSTRTFPVFFRTATFNPTLPPITLTVTDNATILGAATEKIEVRGGQAKTFDVFDIVSPTKAGDLRDVSITARDTFGNIADGFTGKVLFTSSDPLVAPANGLPDGYTFVNTDFGKAKVLGLVALKTAGLQSVTVTDELSGLVFGKQSNILVTPDVAKTLEVSGHSTPIVAGTLSNITILARDKFGNVATDYSGTVTFTSTDVLVSPGNGLPANYTFQAGDGGVKTFVNESQLKTAGTQSITATDTATKSINGRQNSIVVVAGAAAKFNVIDHATPVIAGTKNSFTIEAADKYGNRSSNYTGTVNFTSTDLQIGAGNGLPNPYTFLASDGGKRVFANGAQLKTVGVQTIIATDANNNFTGQHSPITVTASAASQFSITGFPSPTIAGKFGSYTVTARDPFGNVANGYLGTVRFSSSDTQVAIGKGLPTNYTFTAADQGVKLFQDAAALKTAGLQSLTATDVAVGTIVGSQTGILVLPDAPVSFSLSGHPSPVQAGSVNTFTVLAKDKFNNLATNYLGTVLFSSSDLQIASGKGLPTNYTFTTADKGQRSFQASLKTAGTQSLTVTDIVNPTATGTQTGIQVTAGALNRLTVGGYPSPVLAGLSTGMTVAAADAFGNPISNFTGSVTFSTSDKQGEVPTNYTFLPTDNGRKTFSTGFILKTAGAQSVTATVVGNNALTGTQNNIQVVSTDAVRFVVKNFPSPLVAGTTANFTVEAQDPFGNLATSFNGNVTITSTDARAIISNPISLNNGVGTGTVTFRTAGTQGLTITDPNNESLTSNQGGIVVEPAPAGTIPPPVPAPLDLSTLTAVGNDAGTPSIVRVLNPDGTIRNEIVNPYDPGFLGGARAALQRTPNGPRVVVAPGAGRFPDVKVFDLKTGREVFNVQPFETSFTGGVFISTGDINGDGWDDIVMSPDDGGGPRVTIVDGQTGNRLADFFGIDDKNFRGGARATLTDVNGDGSTDLIVSAGIGGGPRIAIYDGASVLTGNQRPTRLIPDFFAFEPELRNGAYVAGGDVDNDGVGDLAFGAGPGGGPRVRVVSGQRLMAAAPFPSLDLVPQVQIANFFAGNTENRGGIRVTMKKLDNDDLADITTGAGGGGPRVTSYTGQEMLTRVNPGELWNFNNDESSLSGVFVG